MKPNLYIINLHENQLKNVDKKHYAEILGITETDKIIPISAKIEEDLAGFSPEEAALYLEELGFEKSGLDALVQVAYDTLGLMTYFTSGPKETRAWTIPKNTLAPAAAGVIHTDFEKGFIKAEVIAYDDFLRCDGEFKAKEKGLMRLEGKDYIVKNGDVMHFKFAT